MGSVDMWPIQMAELEGGGAHLQSEAEGEIVIRDVSSNVLIHPTLPENQLETFYI